MSGNILTELKRELIRNPPKKSPKPKRMQREQRGSKENAKREQRVSKE
jgi:hypothetical protein